MASDGHPLTAVDLFAGGGGLTVGLKRAGFSVVAAVEVEAKAMRTYEANHLEVTPFVEDARNVVGEDLRSCSPTGEIDLLAGCPPCQGFSSLTSKYRRDDPRNALVLEMGRLVEEVNPRAVMMENVSGLADKGKPLLDEFLGILRELGYLPTTGVLQVADYGVPQRRRRLVVLAGRGFEIGLPNSTHHRIGARGLRRWRTLRQAIGDAEYEPATLAEARAAGGPRLFDWHVVRNMAQQNVERLRATRPGGSRAQLPRELRPACHQDSDEGFTNTYGRMTWEQIPVTITGGCTQISKGRFGHPERDRTISVREAATIQTFPADYFFDTPYIGQVCDIIGNALPCDFAERVAESCAEALAPAEQEETT